jgi:hypothetical protein
MPARKILLFSLLLLFSLNVFAQDTDNSVKEKTDEAVKEKQERELKLLEQILSDAKNLRLPENRAFVFARVGNALWLTDEKAARKLFEDAIGDIIAAQLEVQSEKSASRQYFQPLLYGQTPRHDIINLIGLRNAELALEYLEKSRPPVIAEAVKNPTNDQSSAVQQYARNEISLEQRLIALAAEQNPQLYIQRIRESMKKGVSYETLNLLRKIYAKDPPIADKLAEELAESLLSTDFTKYSQTAEIAGYFIAEVGKQRQPDEKSLKISDELLRRVVTKMTDDWLSLKNQQPYGYWNCMAVIEKLFPERAARLKKKVETSTNSSQNDESQRYSKLLAAETTPEEMLAQADKFQSSYRNEIYRAAAAKYASNGNVAEAERILQTNISDEQTEQYLTQLYINLANQFSGQGKFDEASSYINRITDEYQRCTALINLANSIYWRNPKENQKMAVGVLNQARALIPDTPETQNELNAASYLATAYAPLDAGEAFRLVESLIPTMNELIQANFVLMKFRSYGGVRQGEIQIVGGNNLGTYNMENTLRMLKDKDFDRTLQFANAFNRPETRIWLQMHLIDENLQITNLPIQGRRFTNFIRK